MTEDHYHVYVWGTARESYSRYGGPERTTSIEAVRWLASSGDGFRPRSHSVGMMQDLSPAGAVVTELLIAARWDIPTMPASCIV